MIDFPLNKLKRSSNIIFLSPQSVPIKSEARSSRGGNIIHKINFT